MMKGNRLLYIDILKAFGIFLVILGHVLNDNKHPVSHFIYSFHMPLFFALSGVFFVYKKEIQLKELIRKRWKSMLKPYLFFYIITFLYWALVERNLRAEAGGVEAEWYNPILGLFWQGMDWNLFAHNNPIWFIPCLMSVSILAWMTCFLKDRYRLFAVLLFVFLYILTRQFSICLPWELSIAFLAYGFFLFGKAIPRIATGGILCLLIIIEILLFWLYPADKPYISMLGLPPGYILYYYVRALIAITIFVVIGKYIERHLNGNSKWINAIEYIGANTLIILCVHDPIKRAVIFVFSKISGFSITLIREDITWSFACSIIVLALMFPTIWLYKRYFEKLIVR